MKKKIKQLLSSLSVGFAVPVLAFAAASAETATVLITPTDTQGWSNGATTSGGAVNFIEDSSSPFPNGALQLTTDSSTGAKAQYMHATSTPLDEINDLGFSSKQNDASFTDGNASYQLPVFLNGTTGFTTLVFEPYQNGTVEANTWQDWDVDEGMFWSTQTVSCTGGEIAGGGGGAPFYTLEDVALACPDALALGFGVNIGSNNPSYDISVDGVVFNETTYDFEPALVTLSSKDACKKGGWATSDAPVFKNQGDCVSHFASDGRSNGNPVVGFLRSLF